ncbi:MAG: helix-turn-helix transcriptional regulator [Stigonema ocellatum SAG 48.90 = DSM 106950]|nr:helix-turn-helix transcriptional regulator [Stigonema ocellatum SAG 48.90 = DSM 106950]
MTIAPLDLILLLGSLQGVILATLLWTNRKGHRLSNRLLATLIGLLALMSLAVGVPVLNKWVSFALELLPLIVVMPLGPLIYFYVKSVLDPTFQLDRFERYQFCPVVLDLGATVIGWMFVIGVLLGVFNESQGPSFGAVMDEYNTYIDIPRWLSVTLYLVLTRQLLAQPVTMAGGKDPNPVADRPQRRSWLWQFVNVFLVFQLIWLIHLVPYIIPTLRGPLLDTFGWYPVYVPLAVLIYWLGLKGYLYARNSPVEVVPYKINATSLPAEIVEKAIGLLTNAMQTDKLYLDPELTVDKVGRHVRLPAKTISFVLNQYHQKSFNTFINEYRIEAVKHRLANPASDYLTLTGIAFECGFNSQATFQRAFKQIVGVSPKEYNSQLRGIPIKSRFE